MEKLKEKKQEIEIQRFTVEQVLSTKDLESMSNSEKKNHIEYLEKVALSLDNGLTIAIEELNKRHRAMSGELL